MPKNEPSADDPLELVGCAVPCQPSDTEYMALCFMEELFFIGWSRMRILETFRNPFYRGPHGVYQRYGEDWVEKLLSDVERSLRSGEDIGARPC